MSDVSQGPGWWIASDGKWYPPELHPCAPATTAAVPASSVLPDEEIVGATWQGRSEWAASEGDVPHQMSGGVPYDESTVGDLLTSSTITSTVLTDSRRVLDRPVPLHMNDRVPPSVDLPCWL